MTVKSPVALPPPVALSVPAATCTSPPSFRLSTNPTVAVSSEVFLQQAFVVEDGRAAVEVEYALLEIVDTLGKVVDRRGAGSVLPPEYGSSRCVGDRTGVI